MHYTHHMHHATIVCAKEFFEKENTATSKKIHRKRDKGKVLKIISPARSV